MKTLIVYYSFTGNNAALADELRRRLDCDMLRVTETGKRSKFTIMLDLLFKRRPRIAKPERDLAQYDRLILIAPIWAAKIAMPMAALIASEKDRFRRYAFITVCSGADGQLEKIDAELTRLTGKKPIASAQLGIRDLLPAQQKDKIRYLTSYRLKKEDFSIFDNEIERFVQHASGRAAEASQFSG